MFALQGLAEHLQGAIKTLLSMLNAIDQVMSVLPLESLIESESRLAREAHQIGVPHHFDSMSHTAKDLCSNLRDLMHFKNDGRMRDVQRGNVPFSGKRFNLAASDFRCICEQLDHHKRTAFGVRLPPPREPLASFVP